MQRAQVVSAFLALGFVACSGGGASTTSNKPASSAPANTSTVAKAEFGVAECDEYISKVQACIDSKVPEAAREMSRQGFEQTRAAWKQAAATPEGKAGLATGCKMALESARTAYQAYGCQW